MTNTLSKPDTSKPETSKNRSVRFVKLSSFNVPLSFEAFKSGLLGAVGAVASTKIAIDPLSADVFPAESITK